MGKRSSFERRERDFYRTPAAAVTPLLPHLMPRTRYVEPCAGDGSLIGHLSAAGHVCALAYDIEPLRSDVGRQDALTFRPQVDNAPFDCFITNSPWTRSILHPLIDHLSDQAPTWLLFDADWVHTRQAGPFLPRLRRIVSVGRVKWIEDSPFTGKDNCAWHLFDARDTGAAAFFGQAA
jgi:hypothetical protein